MLIEFILIDVEEIEEKPYQIWFSGLLEMDNKYFKFDFTVTHFSKIETSFVLRDEQTDPLSYSAKKVIYKLLQSEYNKVEERVTIAKSASTIFKDEEIKKLWSSAIEALRRNIK